MRGPAAWAVVADTIGTFAASFSAGSALAWWLL
jgi:hypothetical protein